MAEDKSKAALNKAKDFENRADTYNASQIQVLGGLEAIKTGSWKPHKIRL